MKINLTKKDGLHILNYYNIQIPNNDLKIIENANKFIEDNLCKCITSNDKFGNPKKNMKYNSRVNKTKKQKI